MKKISLLFSFLALCAAKPNGYFHQEYSYKSSSSSYKNNELQHKKDDQSFYSKDGDLEGRVQPKVNSQSQHSEYTNPKLLSGSTGYQAAGYSGAGAANYMASSDRLFGGSNSMQNAGAVDGLASSDRVLDLSNIYNSRGYGSTQGYGASQGYVANQGYGASQGYGSLNSASYGGGSSNYGYTQAGSTHGYLQHGRPQSTSGSYASNANMNALMQRLQDDMTRQLEHAIYKQYQSSGYSSSVSSNQMNADIRLLEDELRRNLTRQLQDSLSTQYGSSSYGMVEGRPSTVPNYSTQELAALTRRLEDQLINKLHQSVRTTYNRETSNTYATSSNTYRPVVVYPATTLRPYYDRPVITTPSDIRYTMIPSRGIATYPSQVVVETPSNIRYTPISNPESLTQIASRTQADINSYLDTALQGLYSTYLQSGKTSYYTVTDFDNEVNRIRDEIIRNLTYNLDDQIRKNYGQQILKNDYYYTMSSSGDISTQSNYNLRDYENLKKQVEENLLRKLNQTVNTYRDQYQRQQSQYRESSSSTYAVTYRPVYYTSGNQLYDYSDLQRQMTQQVQDALNKHRYSQSSSYSASTSYNPQAYQTSLDELTRELQRNLTEQLSNYRASSSSSNSYGYSSGTSGGNADYESMKNQLQNQLMQQLRQGLQNQHHYSASASYSASSSSSAKANYGMHQGYSSYPSTCLHGCGRRRRRDLYRRSYSSDEKRHGVKSVRRYSDFQAESSSNPTFSSSGYLHRSYPSAQFQQQSSYHTSFNSMQSKKHDSISGVDPNIVEDLGTNSRPSTLQVEDNLLQLEHTPPKHFTIKYAKQNEHPQQELETTRPLEQIQDDLTQQLELGHQTAQKILKLSGGLENHQDSTQQLEVEVPRRRILTQAYHTSHSRRFGKHDQDMEGQLNLNLPSSGQIIELPQQSKLNVQELDQQIQGQQLESQNVIGRLQKPKHYDHDLEGQLNIDQQQLEDQNLLINPQKLQHYGQELQSQLNLEREVVGQQLEDQESIRNLHKPKQFVQSQLTLDPQLLGQQLEDQTLTGNLHKPKQFGQELEGQLTLGQQLEDQTLTGKLQKPKQYAQELEGQLTLGQQLEDQTLTGNLHKPKQFGQELEGQLTLGQQLEDLTLTGKLQKPKQYPQELEGQLNLGQQLEDQTLTGKLQKPKQYAQELEGQLTLGQQLEDQNTILHSSQYNEPELVVQSSIGLANGRTRSQWGKPAHHDQELEGQLSLSQNSLGQQLEEQNLDQNQQDLNQQLELEDIHKPKLVQVQQQVQDIPFQQLEFGGVRKPKDTEQESDNLTQKLESVDFGKPKLVDYEQQQSDVDLDQKTLDQQQDDLTQQLESAHSFNSQLIQVQKIQQQTEDDVQKLEVEVKPKKVNQEAQSIDDDFNQLLEEQNPRQRRPNSDQQLQNQEDMDQNLELLGSPKSTQESQLILESTQKNTPQEQVENDITQQLEDSPKPKPQDIEDQFTQQLVLTNAQKPFSNQAHLSPNEKQEISDQKLESTLTFAGQQHPVEQLTDQELEEPDQKLVEPEQKLAEPDQKLEQNLLSITNLTPQQTLSNQKIEDFSQLELTNGQKPEKVNFDDQGQQLENDFSSLQLTGTRQPEQTTQKIRFSGQHPSSQSEKTFRQHSQYSTTSQNGISEFSSNNHYPTGLFTGYGSLGNFGQVADVQRPFTNGHSGHLNGHNFPSSNSQVNVLSYEKALKQQDALMDLLKQKVVEAQSLNQGVYGQRTIKKTVFINGKAVDTQESSQLIKPNGEVVDIKGESPLNIPKSMYGGQLGTTYFPTQESGYSGNTLRKTYHLTGSPTIFSGKTQWFSQGKTSESPSSYSASDLQRRGFGQTEFSGKSTTRVVHYVNGKPVSASEKIQILKPNGETIERSHDLPTGELSSLSTSFSKNEFGHGFPNLNVPGTFTNRQNSQESKDMLQSTSHYINSNGKLVDFMSSSKDLIPNEQLTDIERIPENKKLTQNYHSSSIKTSRHYSSQGF